MSKKLLAALAATTLLAPAANAATLVSAAVTGPSGTVWNTTQDSFYTVFLQRPIGVLLNANDDFAGSAATLGPNNFSIAGEGYYPGTTVNSDSQYTLTLTFDDGAVITGDYVFDTAAPGGEFRNGTTATAGNMIYQLTGFGWDRSRADNVSAFRAVSGGDPFDYTGQFSYTASLTAVPEPATWAMIVLGFGILGGAMRTRARKSGAMRQNLKFA